MLIVACPLAQPDQVGRESSIAFEELATHEHLQPMTLLILLHQLILSSGAFFPPIAFECLPLPPACCVPDRGHCDVEEAEAELCCGHDVAFPITALVC